MAIELAAMLLAQWRPRRRLHACRIFRLISAGSSSTLFGPEFAQRPHTDRFAARPACQGHPIALAAWKAVRAKRAAYDVLNLIRDASFRLPRFDPRRASVGCRDRHSAEPLTQCREALRARRRGRPRACTPAQYREALFAFRRFAEARAKNTWNQLRHMHAQSAELKINQK